MAREGTVDHEFLIYRFIYSNKLAYWQPITVMEAFLPNVKNKVAQTFGKTLKKMCEWNHF